MRLQKLLEKEIRIRLTDVGFVETTCFLGIPTTTLAWDVPDPEIADAVADERLMFAPVRVKRQRG